MKEISWSGSFTFSSVTDSLFESRREGESGANAQLELSLSEGLFILTGPGATWEPPGGAGGWDWQEGLEPTQIKCAPRVHLHVLIYYILITAMVEKNNPGRILNTLKNKKKSCQFYTNQLWKNLIPLICMQIRHFWILWALETINQLVSRGKELNSHFDRVVFKFESTRLHFQISVYRDHWQNTLLFLVNWKYIFTWI